MLTFCTNKCFSIISHYAVASTASAAFIIGGVDLSTGNDLSIIAEFSQLPSELAGSWKLRGNLQRARAGAKTVTYLGQTLVFSGGLTEQRFVFL